MSELLKKYGFKTQVDASYPYSLENQNVNNQVINLLQEVLEKVSDGEDLDTTCIYAIKAYNELVETERDIHDTDAREVFWRHFPPNWYGRWLRFYDRKQDTIMNQEINDVRLPLEYRQMLRELINKL